MKAALLVFGLALVAGQQFQENFRTKSTSVVLASPGYFQRQALGFQRNQFNNDFQEGALIEIRDTPQNLQSYNYRGDRFQQNSFASSLFRPSDVDRHQSFDSQFRPGGFHQKELNPLTSQYSRYQGDQRRRFQQNDREGVFQQNNQDFFQQRHQDNQFQRDNQQNLFNQNSQGNRFHQDNQENRFQLNRPSNFFQLNNQDNSFQLNNQDNSFQLNNQDNSFQLNNQDNSFQLNNQDNSFQQNNQNNFFQLNNQDNSFQQNNQDNSFQQNNQANSFQLNNQDNSFQLNNQDNFFHQNNQDNLLQQHNQENRFSFNDQENQFQLNSKEAVVRLDGQTSFFQQHNQINRPSSDFVGENSPLRVIVSEDSNQRDSFGQQDQRFQGSRFGQVDSGFLERDFDLNSLPAGAQFRLDSVDTSFQCSHRPYGFYADQSSGCRVFHVCNPDLFVDGHSQNLQSSFMCGEGYIFDQRRRTCVQERLALPCHEASNYYFTYDK